MGYESPSPLGSQCSSRHWPAVREYCCCGRAPRWRLKTKGLTAALTSPLLAVATNERFREPRAGFGQTIVASLEITGRNGSK